MDGIIEYPLISADEIATEAWAAMNRQDAEEALLLWQRLRQYFPARPEGHICPVQVLWQAGRLDEAEAMAAAADARFPDNPEILVQHAWLALKRERWEEALKWWGKARARLPERPDTYIWAARALWRSGRADEAKAMADAAVERFPANADAQAERAWVAVSQQDWEAALRHWTAVFERHPERADAHAGRVQGLRMVGRSAEAEAMVQASLARFPDNADLMIEQVWTAAALEDWPLAAARLEALHGRLPQDERYVKRLGWVEYQIRSQLEPEDRLAPVSQASAASPAAEFSTGELMLAFESLGEACDFGIVQRKYGVEPLGLLRFGATKYDALIAALADRFAAVGTVEGTGYEIANGENTLYMKRYGLSFHTFVNQKDLPTEAKRQAFREQQRRRLVFLRDKMVADLEDPQKIYIYSTEERTANADMRRLFAALRAYGRNSLLYIRPATAQHPVGNVDIVEDGLYAGYFTRMADFVTGEEPPFDVWRDLCERTYRLAHATPA